MSNTHSQPFERINRLIERRGEKGLKLLFIFKEVKNAVIQRAENEIPEFDWEHYENELNKKCMEIAIRILKRGKENMTEDDIQAILDHIKKTYDTL